VIFFLFTIYTTVTSRLQQHCDRKKLAGTVKLNHATELAVNATNFGDAKSCNITLNMFRIFLATPMLMCVCVYSDPSGGWEPSISK